MEKFVEIYDKNEWGYGSGVGSLPINNVEYIRFLQSFLKANRISTVLDFGCGDWQFSRFVDWGEVSYLGLDVVDAVIQRNRRLFARNGVHFDILSSAMELPDRVDLIICKDVLQHISNQTILECLYRFKRCGRFILITNDEWPEEERTNAEIEEGGWRPIRLDRKPFEEVAPVVLSWTVEWGGWHPTRKSTCLMTRNDSGDKSVGL